MKILESILFNGRRKKSRRSEERMKLLLLHTITAIRIMEANPGDTEDIQLMELFVQHGIPEELVTTILVFLPIACFRCYPDLQLQQTYLEDINGTITRRYYSETPDYIAVHTIAMSYIDTKPAPENFLKIAGRSAGFRGANELLSKHEGEALTNIQFTEDLIIW